jgi:hypothetical protein
MASAWQPLQSRWPGADQGLSAGGQRCRRRTDAAFDAFQVAGGRQKTQSRAQVAQGFFKGEKARRLMQKSGMDNLTGRYNAKISGWDQLASG